MPKNISQIVKKNKWKILGLIVAVVLVLIGRGLIAGNGEEPVVTQKVVRRDLVATISASGAVEGKNQASLHFQTPGKLAWVGVSQGDEVKKWQTLAGLDAVQLNANFQIARSNLRAAEATLDRVYDSVKGHDEDESFAQREIRTNAEVAKNNAYDAVLSAQNALENANLIAPFSGTVVSISDNFTPGANVTLTDTIVIADVSEFKFTAQVDEVDFGKIKLGQKARIFLDAFPDETFEGTVSYISKAGARTATGGVAIPVEIQFDPKGYHMAVGLSGDVEFVLDQKENALVIPKNYLKQKDGASVVYVFEDGKKIEKKVSVGLTTLTEVEITEGLEEGQMIVLPDSGKE